MRCIPPLSLHTQGVFEMGLDELYVNMGELLTHIQKMEKAYKESIGKGEPEAAQSYLVANGAMTAMIFLARDIRENRIPLHAFCFGERLETDWEYKVMERVCQLGCRLVDNKVDSFEVHAPEGKVFLGHGGSVLVVLYDTQGKEEAYKQILADLSGGLWEGEHA